MSCEWPDKIFSVTNDDFERLALEMFNFQYKNNRVYSAFVDAIGVELDKISILREIPFLPINFFKSHDVKTGDFVPSVVFESSGITRTGNSRHLVKDEKVYIESFLTNFTGHYGSPGQYCFIGLLPSYLERSTSSLVYMTDHLIRQSGHPLSGFYLDDFKRLSETLVKLEQEQQPTILLGATFALLDFAEQFPAPLRHTIIMETGGMKGRRKEMTRMEVHDVLKKAFGKKEIHSEYGMTELLSQAYSKGEGIFHCPSWMKILVRDDEDPLNIISEHRQDRVSGAINIIDLANVYSCSFIATEDIGKLYPDGSFEVLGRMDGSDLRGCSLLVV